MGRNSRELVAGILKTGATILALPVIIVYAVGELVKDDIFGPLGRLLDNWVDSAPDADKES
jgi:hypothetical protein